MNYRLHSSLVVVFCTAAIAFTRETQAVAPCTVSITDSARFKNLTDSANQLLPYMWFTGDTLPHAVVLQAISYYDAACNHKDAAFARVSLAAELIANGVEDSATALLTAVAHDTSQDVLKVDRARGLELLGFLEELRGDTRRARSRFLEAIQLVVGSEYVEGAEIHRVDNWPESWSESTAVSVTFGHLGALERRTGDRSAASSYLRKNLLLYIDPLRSSGGMPTQYWDDELTCAKSVKPGLCAYPSDPILSLKASLARARFLGDAIGERRTLTQLSENYRAIGQIDSANRVERQLSDFDHFLRLTSAELGRVQDPTATTVTGLQTTSWNDSLRVGSMALRQGNRQRAVGALRAAIAEIDSFPILDSHYNEIALTSARAEAFWQIARAYRQIPPARLDTAVSYYDTASTAMLNRLARVTSDDDRVSVAEQATKLHTEWALAWLLRSPDVGRGVAAENAIGATERGRARGLRLARGDLRDASDFGEPLEFHPVGDKLPFGFMGLGRSAEEITAVVYMVTDSGIYSLFHVDYPDTTDFAYAAITRKSLAATIDSLRAVLSRQAEGKPSADDSVRYLRAAMRLKAALLPAKLLSAIRTAKELVIVPQAELDEVPFAVLPLTNERHPLGLEYPIRYGPSLGVLGAVESDSYSLDSTDFSPWPFSPPQLLPYFGHPEPYPPPLTTSERNAFNKWKHGALVIGNPSTGVRTEWKEKMDLDDLPFADREADSVAKLFGVRRNQRQEPSEKAFSQRARDATVIHLATHASSFNGKDVSRSWIALTPDNNSDGYLTVAEILSDGFPHLKADLVFLSACKTGLGTNTSSEGTIGFQRAFLIKGARSLIISLWSVDDVASAFLVKSFYSFWLDSKEQMTKPEALRRAMRLTREKFPEPGRWAALQLVGAQ